MHLAVKFKLNRCLPFRHRNLKLDLESQMIQCHFMSKDSEIMSCQLSYPLFPHTAEFNYLRFLPGPDGFVYKNGKHPIMSDVKNSATSKSLTQTS